MAKKVDNTNAKKVKKPVKQEEKALNPNAFENKNDLVKLYVYTVIVNLSVGRNVEKLMQNLGSSIQFTNIGRGTASKEILNILGVPDDTKAVVHAIVNEDRLEDIQRELTIFFAANKKNRGIGFAIPFSSIEGVRIYKYLTQTM